MLETWKAVVGYEGLYEVSDRGEIRSVERRVPHRCGTMLVRSRVLKSSPSHGYPAVALHDLAGGRGQKTFAVHRLALKAFVGPCPDGMEACHNDGVPINNDLTNLRWDTPAANQGDRREHGTDNRGGRHPLAKLTTERVLAIRKQAAAGDQYSLIADRFGVTTSAIGLVVRRKRWAHI